MGREKEGEINVNSLFEETYQSKFQWDSKPTQNPFFFNLRKAGDILKAKNVTKYKFFP